MSEATSQWRRLPTVSVVIPTMRPAESIGQTLEAALRDDTVIEVLLVVDGPGAATLGDTLDALDAASPRLRVLRLPHHVGGEMARRIGAEAALGEVVWFLDDDVVPDESAGRGHAVAHASGETDLVVGPIWTPHESISGTARVSAWLYEESFHHEFARQCADASLILRHFWAANYSIRRGAVLALDPVPPVFQRTRHSDRAFGLMCLRAGLRARAHPELTATHHHAPPLDRWRADCREQGVGRTAIHRCFPDETGPIIPRPWALGLGRRGRVVLRLSEMGALPANLVASSLAAALSWAARKDKFKLALELGRILRSVEQSRGAARAVAVEEDTPSVDGRPLSLPKPADLSLLVISRGPSSRLRRVLEIWRPHVAEIVVVADLSGEPGLLDAVADLADRTSAVENAFPIESVLKRCWPLCTRSFVFRGDDDEVPATVLLAELRSLTLDAALQQAGIPMRWVWPSPATWIDGYPWSTNPQPKLIRNLAGLIEFPGRVHTAEHLPSSPRQVPLPLYHLRTLDPIEDRRGRVARYVAVGGGQRHLDGRPANSQYLPEEADDLRLARVPEWDVPMVSRVAEGAESGAWPQAPATPGVDRAANLAPAGSAFQPGARGHRASVRISGLHPPVGGRGCLVMEVVIANRSDDELPGTADGGRAISLSTRWHREAGSRGDEVSGPMVIDGQRFDLGEPIPPGRAVSRVVAVEIDVPPGTWRVVVDLVEESVDWFGDGDEFVVEILPQVTPLRRPHAPDLFQAVLIETRNTCNRQCWFCKFGQERRDPEVVQMDWPTIRQIIANLADLDFRGRVSWYGINEPLLDPRIYDILAETRAACPEAFISLVTNGDLLTPERHERLKASGADVVGVSVYDDVVFSRVRRFADQQMKLIDMRTASPGRLENRGGTVRRNEDQFREDAERFRDHTCERPSFMMSVKASGLVGLCCADMYGDVVMGDVRHQRLEQIWHGEKFALYRHTLAHEGRRNLPLCQGCSYTGMAGRIFYPLPETVTHPRIQVGRISLR